MVPQVNGCSVAWVQRLINYPFNFASPDHAVVKTLFLLGLKSLALIFH